MELKQDYTQTEVGVLPSDWDTITIFESADRKKELFDDGDWIEAEHITDRGIRLIQTGNIGIGKFVEKDIKKYIFQKSYELLKCKNLKIGDLLLCRLAEPAGRSCIFPDLKDGVVITSVDVTIFRPNETIANRNYLNQYFTTKSWFNAVSENCGGTTHKRISRGALGKLKVPLPPLPEQTAIANALSDMDALISQIEKLIEKKKAIKQGTMQELLKPKEGWLTKKLGDVILSFQNGNAFSAVGYVKNGTPIVTMAQIGLDGAFNFNESKVNRWVLSDFIFLKSYHLKNGDLIMAMTDVTPEKNLIGRMALVKTKETLLLNQRVGLLRIDSSKTNAYFLKTISNMKEWRSYCIGIASLGVQANIGTKDILNGEILMPDVTLQDEIEEILTTMDNELSQIQHKLTKLKQQKQGMMQALLTGKIRLL